MKKERPKRASYYALAVLTFINLLNYIDRYVLPSVLPLIKKDLNLTDTELGIIASSFMIVYSVTAPVFGRIGDLFARKKILALGITLWSVATAVGGLANSFWQLFVPRSAIGIGEASYGAISPTIISDYFSKERRGRAFAVFYAAIPIGSALGFLLGGKLAEIYNWRYAFYIVGLPGILVALATLTIQEPRRGAADEEENLGASKKPKSAETGLKPFLSSSVEAGRLLAQNKVYVTTSIGFIAYTFALGGLAYWAPTYLERIDHMPLKRADAYFGAMTVVAGFSGTFVGGFLSDHLFKYTKRAYLLVSSISVLIGAPIAFLALISRTPSIYLPALFLAEFFLFLNTGPLNTVLINCVQTQIRATAMAVNMFFIHMLGDAISPTIIGWISDRYNLVMAVQIAPIMMIVSGTVLFIAARLQKEG